MKCGRVEKTNHVLLSQLIRQLFFYCYFKLLKFKYVSDYMLIYVKILKSSNCLDILHADAQLPALHILLIFFQSNQDCLF